MKRLRSLCLGLLLSLVGCDLNPFTAGLLAPTPTAVPSQVILTPDRTSAQVGEVITVHMQVLNLGMPLYTITLTPGESLRVLYSGSSAEVVATAQSPVFEIVSTVDAIQAGEIRLRAVAPGTADLSVFVSGEGAARQPGTDHYVFYWANSTANVRLTVTP